MNWTETLVKLQAEFPKFKVVVKEESKLMRFFNFFLSPFNPSFMSTYTVTLGQTIYMPKWMIGKDYMVEVLRHEAVHIRDSKKWGPLYYISYCILPIGPAFRAYWELRGYTESMQCEYDQYGYVPEKSIKFYASQFTSSNYLWMFPFPKTIEKMLRSRADKMIKGD
jgi:hypothetical protein